MDGGIEPSVVWGDLLGIRIFLSDTIRRLSVSSSSSVTGWRSNNRSRYLLCTFVVLCPADGRRYSRSLSVLPLAWRRRYGRCQFLRSHADGATIAVSSVFPLQTARPSSVPRIADDSRKGVTLTSSLAAAAGYINTSPASELIPFLHTSVGVL